MSIKRVLNEKLLYLIESFVPFRVNCFNEFEVFWWSTIPLDTHKQARFNCTITPDLTLYIRNSIFEKPV